MSRARGVQTGPYANRYMSRRRFLRLGGASFAGAALLGSASLGAGCGQEPAQDGVATVVFSFGPDDSGTLANLVEAFNREFEGEIRVEYREFSRLTDEYFDEITAELSAGNSGVDVIGGDVTWTAEFADQGWIEDLNSRIYTDFPVSVPGSFLDAAITSCSYNNSVWGAPWFTDAGLLYYRSDLLEQAGVSGPPATWEELSEIARQVRDEAGTRYGFVFQGDEYEGGVVNGCEFIWNAGGRILTGATTLQAPGAPLDLTPSIIEIDNPNSVRGLEIQRGLIDDGISPETVANFREQDCEEAFLGGEAVFMRGWPYMYALAGENGNSVEPEQIGVAPLPVAGNDLQSYSCLGGWNLLMNAESPNKDAAWEFIKFACAPEQQRTRAIEGSFLPTLREVYNDSEVEQNLPVIVLGREVIENNLRTRPVTPYYSEVSEALARGFNRNLSGETETQEAVSELQSELQDIVERN
ncbi:Bacterial extracellular solute-binding protein [Rubrobacter radiotolerans]|uniref:ABC transporter substrate-binding protein n=1 Tax=Rubrobacter radiotolerans TaxID=42256 RepID=A0A023X6C6_RUBRA|nr:ABC transporter substrate-binding protein [Rubrobacter radiotolerans]AHY47589.1 Bacterial extracellular solute-binding protein [Rubrobacter radiotolerans]MDX5894994.1 ABC transporter substrate-binding protein [Rubrobacter radiotolerans]SMC07234.1 multiple sugar transport system substrate-binding protein [Rubrobacter radiotolerans DSM 5868]